MVNDLFFTCITRSVYRPHLRSGRMSAFPESGRSPGKENPATGVGLSALCGKSDQMFSRSMIACAAAKHAAFSQAPKTVSTCWSARAPRLPACMSGARDRY